MGFFFLVIHSGFTSFQHVILHKPVPNSSLHLTPITKLNLPHSCVIGSIICVSGMRPHWHFQVPKRIWGCEKGQIRGQPMLIGLHLSYQGWPIQSHSQEGHSRSIRFLDGVLISVHSLNMICIVESKAGQVGHTS